MNLYLLRHAVAAEAGQQGITRDADRPLTPKGERRTWRAAEAMETLEVAPDLILSSPLLRARRTAEIVADALNQRKLLELTPILAPGGSFKKLVDLINRHHSAKSSVLLVGHEPYLSDLVALLLFGQERAGIVMKKGGLCALAINGELKAARCAELQWLLTPKQLDIIG